ncbi:MAG: hypothetical protein IJW92_03040 [Clostridia bacterium]|nr:hypothetical protein [Clostridia bacterium]
MMIDLVENEQGLRHLRSPCEKKSMVGFFDARNLRFLPDLYPNTDQKPSKGQK